MTRAEALLALADGCTVRSRSMLIRLGRHGFETRFEATEWAPAAVQMDHDDYTMTGNESFKEVD